MPGFEGEKKTDGQTGRNMEENSGEEIPEGCLIIARSFMAGKEKFHLPLVFGGGKGSVIFLIQFLNIVCQRIAGVRIMINLEQKSR